MSDGSKTRTIAREPSGTLSALSVVENVPLGSTYVNSQRPPLRMSTTPACFLGWGGASGAERRQEVAALIARYASQGTPLRAVMLARLGPNVWHDSPGQAMAVLEELEETAKLWNLADPKPQALDAPALEALRAAFGAAW